MSEHSTKPTNTADDEIDLSVIFKAIQDFFKKILIGIINIFRFYWKHKFILLGLIILGVVLGYIWEKNIDKTYKNQLLVIPNFESANYLYNKIEALESKILDKDTLFLREVFGNKYEAVTTVAISPVIDIYNFVSLDESNQELFELLFEEEANIEFLEDPINSRNYKYHNIYLSVSGEDMHEEFSEKLIMYLNENSHLKSIQQITLESLNLQVEENKMIIAQIDSIISFSKNRRGLAFQENQLNFNDNTGLNELLKMKRDLLYQDGKLKESIAEQSQIINLIDVNYKVIDKDNLLKKSKLKLFPLIFVVLYSLVFLIIYISKKTKELTS